MALPAILLHPYDRSEPESRTESYAQIVVGSVIEIHLIAGFQREVRGLQRILQFRHRDTTAKCVVPPPNWSNELSNVSPDAVWWWCG